MSERQTKAGNQEFKSLNVIENCEQLEKLTNQSTFKSIPKESALTKLLLDIVEQQKLSQRPK